MSDLLTIIVTSVLSGSLFAAAASLLTGRAIARKTTSEGKAIDAKLPAEVDSVVVKGAESAVLAMDAALKSATARIAELVADRAADRKRITELELKVEDLRGKVDAAEEALGDARRSGDRLRDELAAFVRETRDRK